MKLLFTYLFALFVFLACNKTTNPSDFTELTEFEGYDGKLEVVWQKPLLQDTTLTYTINQEFVDGDIILSERNYQDPEKLIRRKGTTGELVWKWTDEECTEIVGDGAQAIMDRSMIVGDGSQIFVVDVKKGKTKWKSKGYSSRPRLSVVDGYIYFSIHDSGTHYDKSHLIRSPVDEQQWSEVLNIQKENNFRPGIEPPVHWKNEKQEDILIFQNRSYNFNIGLGKIDIYAYNLSESKIEWIKYDVVQSGNSSIFSPIIHEDKIYFQGSNSVHCMDAATGEMRWERQFENIGLYTCNNVIAKDKLIVNFDNEDLMALDLTSGSTIWSKPESESHNSGNMVYFNDHVYFTSEGNGNLYAVNVDSGEIVWNENSPNEVSNSQAGFRSGLAIDEASHLLYVSDGLFVMCIKLN